MFGLLDDRFQFPSRPQYLAQFLSSLIAIAFIIFIERVNNPFGAGQIVFPWPVVWAADDLLVHGHDQHGQLAGWAGWTGGGVAAIMSAVLAIHMIREGQYSVALLPVALLGATLGFLPFNFNPARVFMGSNGSYFLGWALAALGIIAGAKVATVLLVMGLADPGCGLADLLPLAARRAGASLAGRDHLHYRLLDMGFTQRQIVLGYYVFCAAFGVLALGLGSRLFKLVALLVLAAAALAVLVWASRQPVRQEARERRWRRGDAANVLSLSLVPAPSASRQTPAPRRTM